MTSRKCRSKFEIDMEILGKCTTPKRVTQLLDPLHLNLKLLEDRVKELVKKEFLTQTLLASKGMTGRHNLLLSNHPQKFVRRIWTTSENGLLVVKSWKQFRRVWEGGKPFTN